MILGAAYNAEIIGSAISNKAKSFFNGYASSKSWCVWATRNICLGKNPPLVLSARLLSGLMNDRERAFRGKANTELSLAIYGAVMARSKDAKRKGTNRLVYAIPLIALVLIAAVYAASVVPAPSSPAAMDFTVKLLVSITYNNGSRQAYWAPTRSVGEAGGIWETHQYDSYGVNSHYPLYMDDPTAACPPQAACEFHVKSNVVHQYTLGDYLALLGYPTVNQNDTLGLKRSGNFAWQSCIGPTGHAVPNFQWGAMVLRKDMDITLLYYDTVNGFGCA
jgi:hypothetical protein